MPEPARYGQARYGQARYASRSAIPSPPISPPTPRKKTGPMTDYIPQSYENLSIWLLLQQTGLTTPSPPPSA
jgi:hypothetical protein